ncbi:cytochrome P450 [Xylaria bambusicola]|uniref:cytochrome P450 n=1 Tax=Xylaria bambusicola TaxID=326684 RepID=UPI0020084A35|nr:cytochrome P450 [Xylaria bambusicola]KAI0508452.1 cytochrome P450 [Xylaria bambusicola]
MASAYAVLPLALSALICARLLINWLRLRKAPGPVLAGSTDLWRAYQQYNGRLRNAICDLHALHGPIVRYGVRSISISDPEVISVVYGSRAGFTTAHSYDVLIGIQNGKEVPSLVSTRDEARHAALRRSVANSFTPTAVLDYESSIDATIGELLAAVDKKATFDLSSMILWYTMDAAARFSFGEPLGCLAAEGDVGGSIQLIRDRFNHWGRWSSLPVFERLIYRNPIAMRLKRAPSSMAAAALSKLKSRSLTSIQAQPDLLQKFLNASRDNPRVLDTHGIIGMLMSTISGAGDTTATTIVATLYQLLQHPPELEKVEAELVGLPEVLPAFSDVSKLPYLNAVIKESMRVFPSSTFPIERLVPQGGVTIAGMHFPAGTSIGCLPSAMHRNTKIYGEDAHIFRPERWLTPDKEQLRLMEATHMGFSRGRRVCLGQHVAMMSMKKVIASILLKYKLSLLDPNGMLDLDFSPAVACLKSLYVTKQAKY